MDQGKMLQIKEESGDTEVDIEPSTLQHMDLHNRIDQRDTSIVKQESAIQNLNVDVTMCSGVKQESKEMVLTGVDGQQCDQATLVQVGVGSVQQGIHITVKGAKLVIEPIVIQHKTDQQNASVVKTENTIACHSNDVLSSSEKKEESVEDNFREPDTYKCYFCQKTFTDEGSFKAHMTCTHSEGTFKCKQCRKSFRQKRYLTSHIAYMHIARTKECNICGKSMKPEVLKIHLKLMHSDEQLQCTCCGETVRSRYYLQLHMNKHRIQQHKPFSGARLVSSKERLWSMLFSCRKCVETFTCEDIFRQHYRLAHATEYKECNKESKLESYFHVQITHSGILQYECICKKIYKSKQCLHDHVLKDHPSGSTDAEHNIVYVCKICGKNVMSEQERDEHENFIHKQQSIDGGLNIFYICKFCGESTSSEQHLSDHVNHFHGQQSIDAGPNIYICDYCQKTFHDKFKIIIHITCVHASGSYKCDQCERSFKCESYLKAHRGNIHAALKKQCKICGKKLRPYYLKLHMLRVHNNRKVQEHHQQSTSSNMAEASVESKHPAIDEPNAATSASTQQQSAVVKKEESADQELELGPVVFQHMDCNYRSCKVEPLLD